MLKGCKVANFENDTNSGRLESRQNVLAHNSAVMVEEADFFLRTQTLKASNFATL